MPEPLTAPFPYFGGKRRVAPEIWARFGDVPNYIEPFFGSGAVLLGRPHPARVETVNDLDGLLVNAWRAIRAHPDETAAAADWPVSEADLHARHLELLVRRGALAERLAADARYCEVETAAWWIWGACCWIGTGWCSGDGPWTSDGERLVNGNAGQGIHRQLPHVGDAGRGFFLSDWFGRIAARMERTRIACGDFERVLGDSVTTRHGTTAVLLDPPYGEGSMDYAAGGNVGGDVLARAAAWAVRNGDNPSLRIAFCAYEGAFDAPAGWEAHRWKARGGYGSQADGAGRANASRETIWFSPHCLRPAPSLFGDAPETALALA